jgi:hypothetical protein
MPLRTFASRVVISSFFDAQSRLPSFYHLRSGSVGGRRHEIGSSAVLASHPSPHSQIARPLKAIEVGQQGQSEPLIRIDCSGIELIEDRVARYTRWLRLADELSDSGYPHDAIDACRAAIAECPERHAGFAMLAVVLRPAIFAPRQCRLRPARAYRRS